MSIYTSIRAKMQDGEKQFAVLIDPDKLNDTELLDVIHRSNKSSVDLFFIGGSLITQGKLDAVIKLIKANSEIPAVLFPGSTMQLCSEADAILFLSLISGRNPEFLIGSQVVAAPYLKKSKVEVIATGYMLIESGTTTTALYMSNTHPIPANKPDIAMCTALAGEMLGLKLIYMDGGSGAQQPISPEMISTVKKNINIPLIIGGGIRTEQQVKDACRAGADIVVVGNATEDDRSIIETFADLVHSL